MSVPSITFRKVLTVSVGLTALLLTNAFAGGKAASLQELYASKSVAPSPVKIFVAKEIVTMSPTAKGNAVAVKDGIIAGVGSLEALQKRFAKEKVVVDQSFANKVLTPGLIDPHMHLWLFALVSNAKFITPADWTLPWGDEKGVVGHDAYMKRLKAYEKSLKDPSELLFTWGYHQYFHGKLNRKMLDEQISNTRPVIVWQRSVHEMYFNTKALEMLGLKKSDWENKGEASTMADWEEGHVWEKGLYLVIGKLFPIIASPEKYKLGMERARDYVHAGGITACADPGVQLSEALIASMIEILESKPLPFEYDLVAAGNSIYDHNGKNPVKTLETVREMVKHGGKHIKWSQDQIKLFADGAVYSQLMQLKEGYLDGHTGEWIQTPEDLEASARPFWKAGYQIIVHVNGDMGMEKTLDILDRFQSEAPRYDHRFRIDHFAFSEKEQVARAARLGAVISSNPFYTYVLAEQYSKFGVGPERSQVIARGKTVLENHIPLSFHSDSPMAPARPMLLVWAAVNRLGLSETKVMGPEERISPEEAFRAVTIDAAYAMHKEKEMGSIEIGKKANFTVFEHNPLTTAPKALKDLKAVSTVFEGKVYPLASGKKMEAKLSESTLKKLYAYASSHQHHGDACVANQILQEGFKARMKGKEK
ncbi:MAG: amidohydrolase [Sulfurovum sp.]|nr:amidohydrolase [Sulfurovum sp.]